MTIEEKIDVLDWMRIYYLDRTCLSKEEEIEFNNFAKELKETILVTRCCDKLKNKEKMTFEEWRKANKFKHIYGYYYKNDDKLNHEQVQQIYIEYLKNL